MKRNLLYLHKMTALVILGAFVCVQATAFICGINHFIDASGIKHHHPLGHDHHHDHNKLPEKHHHDSGKHEENGKECCSDFTRLFLSAFGKSAVNSADFSCKQLIHSFVIAPSLLPETTRCFSDTGILNDPPLPPPKIPDIRVFIRSFQV
ncbi:MAG: hypothetical protein M3R17_01140 [Bacteroidota bacterium]|nr:hypothetical protein [Bacteroidota bacterium]